MKHTYIKPTITSVTYINPLYPLCTSYSRQGTTNEAWSGKKDFNDTQSKSNPIWSNMRED